MAQPDYSTVFLDEDEPGFDPLNPPDYSNDFIGPVPPDPSTPEKLPPLSLAGTIPEENVFANSDPFRAILQKALDEGEEALTDAERKQVKQARQEFKRLDAVLAESERRREQEQIERDPERALLQRIRQNLEEAESVFDVGGVAKGAVKSIIDVVAVAGKGISDAVREESVRTPAPVSPFRDTSTNPLSDDEIRAEREFNELSTVEKGRALGKKVGLGAISGGVDFVTQTLDPMINPEKYGTTTGEAIAQTAEGLVDMFAEAPDQAAHLLELMNAPDGLVKLAETAGTILQAGRLLSGEDRQELKEKAVNHLYENPESLLFAVLMAKSGAKGITKAKQKLGPESDVMLIKRSELEKVGEQIVKEKADAVQKREAEKVPVQKQAEGGKEAGKAPEEVPKEITEISTIADVTEGELTGIQRNFQLSEEIAHSQRNLIGNDKLLADPKVPETKKAEIRVSDAKHKKIIADARTEMEKLHEPPASTVQPPETLKLTNEDLALLREQHDIAQLPESERVAHTQQIAEAKAKGYDREALEIADAVINGDMSTSPAQDAGMFKRLAEVKKESNEATRSISELEQTGNDGQLEIALMRRDGLREQIDILTTATKKTGLDKGRGIALRGAELSLETFDVESLRQRAEDAAGRKLLDSEMRPIQERSETITRLETRRDQLIEELAPEMEIERQRVEAEFYADPKVQKRAVTRTETLVENLGKRQEIIDATTPLAEEILGAKGDRLPKELSKANIKALEEQLADLKWNAYNSTPTSTALERIHKDIDIVTDHLANLKLAAKRGERLNPVDVSNARNKMQKLLTELDPKAELAERQAQLESGNVEVADRPPTLNLPPELEKVEIDLFNERNRVRQDIQDLAPITLGGALVETARFLRVPKTIADISGVARQGAIPSATLLMRGEFGAVGKAFTRAFIGAVKGDRADQFMFRLKREPTQPIREQAGLDLSEIFDVNPLKKEESFRSSAAERIPLYKHIVNFSNRHMMLYLNLIRARAFDIYLEAHPNATMPELKAHADVINNISGRGNLLGRGVATKIAEFVTFSPQFSGSRIQTPTLILKHWKLPRVRKEIAKDMVRGAAVPGALLALAAVAGYDVSTDVRSPDFLKIRKGNTRIDLLAGEQQYLRMIARVALTATDRAGVTGDEFTGPPEDPIDIITNYFKYKSSPAIQLPYTLTTGHDLVYQDRGRIETIARAAQPMVSEDIEDAIRDPEGWVLASTLTLAGVGVNTYADSRTRTRLQIAQFRYRDGETQKADALQSKWNITNPDDKIFRVSDPRLKRQRKEVAAKKKLDPTARLVRQADIDLSTLRVDPRTGPSDSLQMLPGIGPVAANKIIEWRKTHKFTSIEDLDSIPGIGKKTIEEIRPYIHLLIEEDKK